MKPKKKETIFALSTPYGQSAIAVIRISGDMSKKIALKLSQIKKIYPRSAIFTKFYDKQNKIIDSGIMIFLHLRPHILVKICWKYSAMGLFLSLIKCY